MRGQPFTFLVVCLGVACAAEPEELARCSGPEGPAVVSDIDATLTTDDLEFVTQLATGAHDPLAREGGGELLSGYAERGYFIVYATGRSEEMVVANTGESARDATLRWLDEHGFPLERSRLYLAPTNADVAGEPARIYKAARLAEATEEGLDFRYAYGNAKADFDAYADVGIPKSGTFSIGPEAGTAGTVAVPGEGWSAHAAGHLPTVPAVCAP